MKQINVGSFRIAFIVMAGIALLATVLTQSIIPLAFLATMIGVYVGFELFIIFQIVYAISQWISHQEEKRARSQAMLMERVEPTKQSKQLTHIPPSGSKG